MTIPAGTVYNLINSTTLTGFSSITNEGTINMQSGFNNHNKVFDCNVINNGTIDYNDYLDGGPNPQSFKSNNGSSVTNNGTINLAGPSNSGYPVDIDIINASGGQVTVSHGIPYQAVMTNQAGGTLSVTAGGDITIVDSLSNSGTVDATGTIRLLGGSHHFDGGTFGGSGYLHMNAGAIIDAPNGFTPSMDTIYTGTFSVFNTVTGTAGSSMTIPAGTVYNLINSTTLTGLSSITIDGTLNMSYVHNNHTHTIEPDITNNGTIDFNGYFWTGRADTTYIDNYGTINRNSANTISNICINNAGTININSGSAFACETTLFDPNTAYVTTWLTTAANESITIQADSANFTYNYSVDWGDGIITTGHTGPATHTYATADTQTIKINGMYPRFSIAGPNFAQFRTVEQWGTIAWENFGNSYRGSQHVTINATDALDLTNVASMNGIFSLCTNFNSNISHWDVSTVPDVRNIFAECSAYNQPLTNWNLTSATDMSGMFRGATIFNQPVSQFSTWAAGSAPKMAVVFLSAAAFNQDISNWDISGASDINGIFQGASSFNQNLSAWDVSTVFFMNNMFNGATAFNQDLGDWNISNVGNMLGMLDSCGLSQMNYDSTLIKWAAQTVRQDVVVVGAAGLVYCDGAAARQSLIDDDGWMFNGDSGCSVCDLAINTQPTNQTICDGEDVTFSVAATSSAGGLTYEWQQICESEPAWNQITSSNTSGFPSDRILDVKVDGDNIYVGSISAGFGIFDGTNWTTVTTATTGFPTHNRVNTIEKLGDKIYVGTREGLGIYDGTNWTTITTSNTTNFPGNNVYDLHVNNGILYLGAAGGLGVYDGTSWTEYDTSTPGFPNSAFVNKVYYGDGKIYAATQAGLGIYDGTSWTTVDSNTSGFPNDDRIQSVYYADGKIYAGTYAAGIGVYDGTSWTTINTTNEPELPSGWFWDIFTIGNQIIASGQGILGIYDGTSWSSACGMPDNPPCTNPYGIDMSPTTLYVGTSQGLAFTSFAGAATPIMNATSDSYTFTPTTADTACSYQVVITDANGCSVTSDVVSITLDIEANCGDTQAPVLSCPENITLTLNVCNEFVLTAADLGVTATDDTDPMPTVTLSQTMFNAPGTTAVIIVATDSTGNADTCVVNVTFEGNAGIFTVTAGADANQTFIGTPVTFSAATLLANDMASNNAALEIQELILTNSTQGTLVDNQNGTWTFTPATNFTGNVAFSYVVKSSDESLYFDGTSHFYEYIVADQITWTAAKAAAEARTLNGLQGYLATITSQAENDFITTKLQGYGWIGASDADVEGEWKWVTGPEAGTQFWQGDASGAAVNGQYNNWVSVEPNNQNNEDYGHSGNNGTWNDWPDFIQFIDGYVVEYGGIDGCEPNFTATGTLNINVVLPAVTPLNSVILSACEDAAGSGQGDFVLTAAEDIENGDLDGNGANGSTSTVTYYPSQGDANNSTNSLANGDNLNPEVDKVWARVVDGFGRVRTIEVRLTLLFLAAPPALSTDSIPRGTYNAPAAVVTAAPVEEGAVVVITSPISATLSPGFSVPAGSECSISIRPTSFVDPCTSALQEEDPASARNLGLTTNEAFQNGMKIYPNPFFEQTNIDYTIETASTVSITVFNSSGAVVANLLRQQEQLPGKYQVIFNAEYYPNGMYTVLLQTNDTHISQRVVLLK